MRVLHVCLCRFGITMYRPPELFFLSGKRWRASYDIWMLGCTFLQLMVGKESNVCNPEPEKTKELPHKNKSVKMIIEALGMPGQSTLKKVLVRQTTIVIFNPTCIAFPKPQILFCFYFQLPSYPSLRLPNATCQPFLWI